LCTDIEKIEPAQRIQTGREITGSIRYGQLDALDMPYKEEFDIILFKSVLGGIGRNNHPEKQREALQQIYHALKPGGELFFAENLAASPIHRYFRKKFVRWGGEWRYVTIPEMLEYLSPFSDVQYTTAGFTAAFGRMELVRKLLGYVDMATDRIVPPSWRYIMIGIARK